MAKASDIAKYLILLASGEDESELMTPMRLQKLLYYAQGWHLAYKDAPMFDESIEAWPWGPVIPTIYHQFKQYGRAGIEGKDVGDFDLSESEKRFVGNVWDTYKGFSAIRLSEMTHKEPPWKAHNEQPNKTIPVEEIKQCFKVALQTSAESPAEPYP